jgi:hypothetical protein
MSNRLAVVDVFTVPENWDGRREATWQETEGGVLVKQNLFLRLWDLGLPGSDPLRSEGEIACVEFDDLIGVYYRVLEASDRFDGTHSRNSVGIPAGYGYERASFRMDQKDELVAYLEEVRDRSSRLIGGGRPEDDWQ